MTDVAYLLSILSDGKAHSTNEILRRSFDDRGHGLMVHSRAADLRARGHQIACEHVPGKKRGEAYVYTLVVGSLPPAEAPGRVSADGSDSQVTPLDRSGPRGAGHAEPHGCPAPPLFEPDELTRKPAWA